MADGSSIAEAATSIIGTIARTTDFSGRSRRLEVVYYWAASVVIGAAIELAIGLVASPDTAQYSQHAFKLLLVLPMFALFARRLHDQNRSAWWSLLLPFSIAFAIPHMIVAGEGVQAVVAQRNAPLTILAGLLEIAVFVMFLLQGTVGPNAYGTDPRLENA